MLMLPHAIQVFPLFIYDMSLSPIVDRMVL
jgi:hypothetical protein